MPRQRTYEPHCPALDCSGGHADRLYRTTAELVEMPPEVQARCKDTEVVYCCSYCGFVWFQSSAAYPGVGATPAGRYDNFRWPSEFHAVSDTYPICKESTRW